MRAAARADRRRHLHHQKQVVDALDRTKVRASADSTRNASSDSVCAARDRGCWIECLVAALRVSLGRKAIGIVGEVGNRLQTEDATKDRAASWRSGEGIRNGVVKPPHRSSV